MRKNKLNLFYTYLITNTQNNKVYVGQTQSIPGRWKDHLRTAKYPEKYKVSFSLIHKAIRKWGVDNFIIEQLDVQSSGKDINDSEIKWIAYYRQRLGKNNVYNLTNGGDGIKGYQYTEKQLKALSERMIGKMEGEKNPFFGKKHSEATKKKISEARRTCNKENYLGSKCSQAKLNEEQVLEIKTKYLTKKYTSQMLCREYQVGRGCIESILSGKTWSQIGPNISFSKLEKTQIYWNLKFGEMTSEQFTCEICKKQFTIKKRMTTKIVGTNRFCSHSCKNKALAGGQIKLNK
jgi:group I intron endonuclease